MLRTANAIDKSVLLIGDMHLPYGHIDYLDFCQAVARKIKAEIIINMGDEVDGHAISFHDSDCELPSAGHELQLAIDDLQRWKKVFPKMIVLSSNHGSLIYRRLKSQGIPMAHLKPLQELYNVPKWKWCEHLMLKTKGGDTYLCHGKAGPYQKLAKEMGCNTWQGHFHSKHEITWISAVHKERYNAFTGCGVNRASLAMAYGKNHIPQPILGCGSIDKNGMPHLWKMNLDAKRRWDRLL